MIKPRPLRLFFALALPLLLVVGGVRLLLSDAFLRFEYTRPGFPSDPYGFTTEDRLAYGMFALDYLLSDTTLPELAAIRLPRELCAGFAAGASDCPLFRARELDHLRDARALLHGAFGLVLAAVAAAICLAVAGRSSVWRQEIWAGLRAGARLSLASVGTAIVVAATAWSSAFDRFHEIFFAPGTWRFPHSDSLIRLYPERLFLDAALIIAALTATGALLVLALSVTSWRSAARVCTL